MRSRRAGAADRENHDLPAVNLEPWIALWDPNESRLAPENRRVLALVAVRFRLSLGEHLDS